MKALSDNKQTTINLITSLAASLFLGEVLSLGHILAMGLTLLGVFGLNIFKNKAEN